MPVTTTVQRNLPFKHAIDNDEIHHRETYTECPPDQSNAKSVRAGKRLLNGDIADSVAARRQKTRVQSDRGSDQHHSEIHTRTGECPAVIGLSREIPNSGQGQQDYNWDRQQNRVGTIVVQSIRTSNDRSWQADYGEHEQCDPENTCCSPRPILQTPFSLHCEI